MKRSHIGLWMTALIALLVVGVSQTRTIVAQPGQPATATLPATPFPTVVPNFTPVYVQKNDDQIETFLELMATPDCELPCLWGMTPGVSTRTEVYELLQSRNLLSNLDFGGFFLFANAGELPPRAAGGEGVGFSFLEAFYVRARVVFGRRNDSEVITELGLSADAPFGWHTLTGSPLSLTQVLDRIDSIPEIYVSTDILGQLRTHDVLIDFLYRREGILLRYVFDFSNEWDWGGAPLFKTCPGLAQTRNLTWSLWDSRSVSSREYLEQRTGSPDPYASDPTIDQILGVSAATFVEFFRKYPHGCIESVVSADY